MAIEKLFPILCLLYHVDPFLSTQLSTICDIVWFGIDGNKKGPPGTHPWEPPALQFGDLLYPWPTHALGGQG
jgi:hypothetical protein